MALLCRRESDALGIKEVQQLGSAQPDACCPEPCLQIAQGERLVLQHTAVQRRVGQDEGTHGLEFVLLAYGRLRRCDTLAVGAVVVRVTDLRVGSGGVAHIYTRQNPTPKLFMG